MTYLGIRTNVSIALLALSAASVSMAEVPANTKAKWVSNRLIVKMKALNFKNFKDQMNSVHGVLSHSVAAQELGFTQTERGLRQNETIVRYSTALNPQEAARRLMDDADVEWAQPDYYMYAIQDEGSDDSALSFEQIFGGEIFGKKKPKPGKEGGADASPVLSDLWGLAKIKAPAAWDISSGSRNIVVADIDTGIDSSHPDLKPNLWHNPKPTNGDVIGYDFANKKADPFDDQGHGTHTAGTIGAGGSVIKGVSPQVSIMALKFITSEGSGTTSDAVLAIDYAIAHGARVMSNSWGGPADDANENKVLEDAVARANTADILFVAAAGNDGSDNDKVPTYPAAIKLPNMLTVAATTNRDTRSFFSNFGLTSVHVGAPGSNVISTVPGGKYASESGTSMACPHVAGLAALILSVNPSLHATEVKQIIMDTVDPIASLNGKIATGGRVNALAALQKVKTLGYSQRR